MAIRRGVGRLGAMKTTLLILMAVALVGCDKKNSAKPYNFTLSPRPNAEGWMALPRYAKESAAYDKKLEKWERGNKATAEWYNSLVVCLHCGSDLARKGAKVCPECLRPQRPFDPK